MTPDISSNLASSEMPEDNPSMQDAKARKPNSEPGTEAINRLLDELDPDRNAAWGKYGKLHSRLTKLFEWRGCSRSTDYADAVLDRVANMLLEGKEMRDIAQFCGGVARKMLLEISRTEPRTRSIDDDPEGHEVIQIVDNPADIETMIEQEEWLACLDSCLEKLEGDDRSLILQFYSAGVHGKRGDKEDTNKAFRKRLAQVFEISPTNLRVRACRIRARIENCVRNCTGYAREGPASSPGRLNSCGC